MNHLNGVNVNNINVRSSNTDGFKRTKLSPKQRSHHHQFTHASLFVATTSIDYLIRPDDDTETPLPSLSTLSKEYQSTSYARNATRENGRQRERHEMYALVCAVDTAVQMLNRRL